MTIKKLGEMEQHYSQCECRNRECAELVRKHGVAMGGGVRCLNNAKYSVDGFRMCTDCMRFRRFPTEGEVEQ